MQNGAEVLITAASIAVFIGFGTYLIARGGTW
jgi:hypothetical protein